MVVRFVDENWIIKQRLLKLDVVSKSVLADLLAQVIQPCLIDYTIRGPRVFAAIHDSVSVNGAAIN